MFYKLLLSFFNLVTTVDLTSLHRLVVSDYSWLLYNLRFNPCFQQLSFSCLMEKKVSFNFKDRLNYNSLKRFSKVKVMLHDVCHFGLIACRC